MPIFSFVHHNDGEIKLLIISCKNDLQRKKGLTLYKKLSN